MGRRKPLKTLVKADKISKTYDNIVVGTVIDANDPMQMGRLRVKCPALGDTPQKKLKNLPWATYVSPLAGTVEVGSRGRGDDLSTGPVAYGMWNIPKVGATVLVACVDGDPSMRVWLGCVHNQLLTHTMPHGRYSSNPDAIDFGTDWDGLGIEADYSNAQLVGPFSSQEDPIHPTIDKIQEAFTPDADPDTLNVIPDDIKAFSSSEFMTRGADNAVSALTLKQKNSDASKTSWVSDDEDREHADAAGDSHNHRQGYKESRIEPGLEFEATGKNYDSQVYAWTTPGFHAISMDDSSDNCRIRFRTTHGHQIIFDDTNERIYVSTAGGKAWIELDEAGNIDFYAERNISFHAKKDFNITADTIRMKADSAVHIESDDEMRIHSKNDFHLKSDTNIRMHAMAEMRLQAIGTLHIDTTDSALFTSTNDIEIKAIGGTLYAEAGTDVDVYAGGEGFLSADGGDLNLFAANNAILDGGASTNINSGGNVLITGSQIHANGPPAATAATATSGIGEAADTEHKESWLTSRVPEHEPWPRVMTDPTKTDQDSGNLHDGSAEHAYDSDDVGKVERGDDLGRNPKWRR